MFVSSYNTYIHTNTTDKTAKTKEPAHVDNSKSSFASKLLHTSQIPNTQATNSPINYIDNSKVFHNRQKLQQNVESKQEIKIANKFNEFNSVKTSKVAYSDNSKMFSIVAKPKPATSSAVISGHGFSQQKAKLSAINTYIKNDMYYQITA